MLAYLVGLAGSGTIVGHIEAVCGVGFWRYLGAEGALSAFSGRMESRLR